MGSVTREKMAEVEQLMKGVNEPPPQTATQHHFADCGIYARETFLPRDSVVMGKIHRYSTINFITMGVVKAVNPEQPEQSQIMKAPYTFVSPAGSKRCVAALTDCIWITVHQAETQDLGELEEQLIIKDYSELSIEEKACLG